MAECLHFVDVEGIPASSADTLPLFYQAVCSLVLHREVIDHRCSLFYLDLKLDIFTSALFFVIFDMSFFMFFQINVDIFCW